MRRLRQRVKSGEVAAQSPKEGGRLSVVDFASVPWAPAGQFNKLSSRQPLLFAHGRCNMVTVHRVGRRWQLLRQAHDNCCSCLLLCALTCTALYALSVLQPGREGSEAAEGDFSQVLVGGSTHTTQLAIEPIA